MLYNLKWLATGKTFPPIEEKKRIERYEQNAILFDGEHFGPHTIDSVYRKTALRIARVIGNFEDVISFPVLLNYQQLMSLKMADLVCGEYPSITGKDEVDNALIKEVRDRVDFDSKIYSSVIDMSRYGDAIQRIYIDEDSKRTFTNWDPREWFPIVSQDGTNTILYHLLCWRENKNPDVISNPDWYLHVQIHSTLTKDKGYYEYRVFKMDSFGGTIGGQIESSRVKTDLEICAVQHLKAYSTTNSIYGKDDYMVIDSILAEIMTRIGQISVILDKHADPNITGPVSMLSIDDKTGEYKLKLGKFFAISPGEEPPQYMVWNGQLESAFKQLELLINQLYILSEMGAALLGGADASGAAISGSAMRFKMVNPLAKARRIANSLTRPVRQLFAILNSELDFKQISVFWSDGLPEDPRENVELAKLATGETALMPLENAITEFFSRSNEEALEWIAKIDTRRKQKAEEAAKVIADSVVNKPGIQDGTGVNTQKKGSVTGLKNFSGLTNKK